MTKTFLLWFSLKYRLKNVSFGQPETDQNLFSPTIIIKLPVFLCSQLQGPFILPEDLYTVPVI